jgi:hypothetical protein
MGRGVQITVYVSQVMGFVDSRAGSAPSDRGRFSDRSVAATTVPMMKSTKTPGQPHQKEKTWPFINLVSFERSHTTVIPRSLPTTRFM